MNRIITPPEFHKFHSIENANRSCILKAITEHPSSQSGNKWVVMEKIHGSNFSLTTNGDVVVAGKRNTFLTHDEYKNFHNVQSIVNKYQSSLLKIFSLLNQADYKKMDILTTGVSIITIYGEIFGGNYVGIAANVHKPIQKDIYYCPDIEFYAFDIRVNNKEYLNYNLCMELFEAAGFYYAKPLFIGDFQEALSFSSQTNASLTTIPKDFGLPDIDKNIREGNVLKPIIPAYFQNHKPIILKDKNEKYREYSVQKVIKLKKKLNEKTSSITDVAKILMYESIRYVVQARYDNLISKDTPITKSSIKKDKKIITGTIKLLTKDVFDDFLNDHSSTYNILSLEDQTIIKKTINQYSSKLVMKNIINL